MRRAILSDIHGNLEALNAVLEDIHRQGIAEIYCLGDIVGYGPNPCECLDLVIEHSNICILGDHDKGVLFDPEGLNSGAERAISWTRSQLENGTGNRGATDARWNFLRALPHVHNDDDWLYVHGSPRNPVNEYVFPEDIYNQKKMDALFGLIARGCFKGHTHVPGVFTENRDFVAPKDTEHVYQFTDERFLVDVGSVGQPRDGDHRACYAVQENSQVTFHRVEYDRDATARKIRRIR